MNRQIVTTGIILNRTEFGEADRIISLLTPDNGKLRLMAKGVRRAKSKLAGGIELFSVSTITFIKGRGEIGTLVSTRLIKHYGTIVRDLDRTMLGYELIKLLDKATEDEPGIEYFTLLEQAFMALDDARLNTDTIKLWFYMQLLALSGHQPDLSLDADGNKLRSPKAFQFDYDRMAFVEKAKGPFTADHIKLLRIGFNGHQPAVLEHIKGIAALRDQCLLMVRTILHQHIRTQ